MALFFFSQLVAYIPVVRATSYWCAMARNFSSVPCVRNVLVATYNATDAAAKGTSFFWSWIEHQQVAPSWWYSCSMMFLNGMLCWLGKCQVGERRSSEVHWCCFSAQKKVVALDFLKKPWDAWGTAHKMSSLEKVETLLRRCDKAWAILWARQQKDIGTGLGYCSVFFVSGCNFRNCVSLRKKGNVFARSSCFGYCRKHRLGICPGRTRWFIQNPELQCKFHLTRSLWPSTNQEGMNYSITPLAKILPVR